jgi:hypothetical protein
MKKAAVPSILVAVVLLAFGVVAEAQQPLKIPLIGRLSPGSPSANTARTEAFRQGLRELGYVEGKNIVIERRSAEGRLDRLPALAADLVRLRPARRIFRGQNPEGSQARRSPGGTAEEVRVHHQSEGGQADRLDDSAECADEGG